MEMRPTHLVLRASPNGGGSESGALHGSRKACASCPRKRVLHAPLARFIFPFSLRARRAGASRKLQGLCFMFAQDGSPSGA